jgi:type IX secretion system PorP/SprF family membrane protein
MKKLLPFLFTALSFFSESTSAQDPTFSQNFSAPLWVNPALAGATGAGRLATIFRDQYANLSGNYQTFYASYDHFVNKIGSGVGFYYLHDQASFLSSSRFGLALSHGFDLSEKKFRIVPGIDLDFVQNILDTTNFHITDPENYYVKRGLFDLGAGLHAITDRLNFSFSAHHLTQPDESYFRSYTARLPIRLTAIIDYVFGKLDEKRSLKVAPSLKYEKQQDFFYVQGGLALSYWKIKLGFAFKTDGYQVSGWTPNQFMVVQAAYQGLIFKLRYCYAFAANDNAQVYGGTHEVTTLFNLFKRKKKDDFKEMSYFGF